jgi:hypothetical protein
MTTSSSWFSMGLETNWLKPVRERLELGPQHALVEGGRRRHDDRRASLSRMAVGLEAVPTAKREEDGASAGVGDRGGEDLVALAGARLGELGPEPLDTGVNGGEVGAGGEAEDAGLQGAHAIERGGVVHHDRP